MQRREEVARRIYDLADKRTKLEIAAALRNSEKYGCIDQHFRLARVFNHITDDTLLLANKEPNSLQQIIELTAAIQQAIEAKYKDISRYFELVNAVTMQLTKFRNQIKDTCLGIAMSIVPKHATGLKLLVIASDGYLQSLKQAVDALATVIKQSPEKRLIIVNKKTVALQQLYHLLGIEKLAQRKSHQNIKTFKNTVNFAELAGYIDSYLLVLEVALRLPQHSVSRELSEQAVTTTEAVSFNRLKHADHHKTTFSACAEYGAALPAEDHVSSIPADPNDYFVPVARAVRVKNAAPVAVAAAEHGHANPTVEQSRGRHEHGSHGSETVAEETAAVRPTVLEAEVQERLDVVSAQVGQRAGSAAEETAAVRSTALEAEVQDRLDVVSAQVQQGTESAVGRRWHPSRVQDRLRNSRLELLRSADVRVEALQLASTVSRGRLLVADGAQQVFRRQQVVNIEQIAAERLRRQILADVRAEFIQQERRLRQEFVRTISAKEQQFAIDMQVQREIVLRLSQEQAMYWQGNERLEQRVVELERARTEMQAAKVKHEQALQAQQQKSEQLEQEFEATKVDVVALKAQLVQQIKFYQTNLALVLQNPQLHFHLPSQQSAEPAENNQDVQALIKRIAELQQARQAADQETARLTKTQQSELQVLTQKLQRSQAEFESIQQEQQARKLEIDGLKKEAAAKEEELARLRYEIDRLQQEAAVKEEELADLRHENEKQSKALVATKAKLEETRAKLSSTSAQLLEKTKYSKGLFELLTTQYDQFTETLRNLQLFRQDDPSAIPELEEVGTHQDQTAARQFRNNIVF